MRPTPLTLKKKLALELWRQREAIIREEHPLKQLFWTSPETAFLGVYPAL